MTFQNILNNLNVNMITVQDAYNEINSKDKIKTINFYAHILDTRKEPMTDTQLQELQVIVEVLQILYSSKVGSPIEDSTYDLLQETLIDMGIPRLSGTIEINDNKKVSHTFKNLRGTLDKVYYLYPDEPRTNKSRKYLDEWIKRVSDIYEKKTGNRIDFNEVKVLLQPKFDGCSAILEWDGKNAIWLSRGDTTNNRASDITHIMRSFNDVFCHGDTFGEKFELMMTEDNKDRINELITDKDKRYHNSRQIVTSTLNSNEPDFKVDYLYPVPLRLIKPGEEVESIHPDLIENFPTKICTIGDRDTIKEFANANRYVTTKNGMKLRTDGAVLTILDLEIQKVLGRDNNVNNFEVAYKFTEEVAYSRVKNIEFYVSEFGYVTPVLVVNDVLLKGNTINHISLSNKERFDELDLAYGDEVKILYDIIPYATLDAKCERLKFGRKIEFVKTCPRCHEPLNLDVVQVQCKNPKCSSRIIGRIMNYCNGVKIQNIGYNTLETLYSVGLLPNGIRSLYKLKKKTTEIEFLEGFGKLKTRKIISEIEAKRKLRDYEFFGSLGIEGLNNKTFQMIFDNIHMQDWLNLINTRNYNLMKELLVKINGIGYAKAEALVTFYMHKENREELKRLLKEVTLYPTFHSGKHLNGKIAFSGCRPDTQMRAYLNAKDYEVTESWSNNVKCLVVPDKDYKSGKVNKAISKGIPIIFKKDLYETL